MKLYLFSILVFLTFLSSACLKQFIPETAESKNLLVIEGLITDQNEAYKVKLSRSQSLGLKFEILPVTGANVTVSDDLGNYFTFAEKDSGVYLSDSTIFRGETGRKYLLHIRASDSYGVSSDYESVPVEMKSVPPIDSMYYQKIPIRKAEHFYESLDNCQIFLDTHDAKGECRYFRWDFTETWEFHLHYNLPNYTCWISKKSENIIIKNTSGLASDNIIRFPLNYIPETSDRLEVKYSIYVNQYSLSQEEYSYWEKLKLFSQDVGGLYDMIPADVNGNISCLTRPGDKVLGYFSVSAKRSQRLFIKDSFAGQINIYKDCASQRIDNPGEIPGLGSWLWIIESSAFSVPPYVVLTSDKGCADCTVRGSINKPAFWEDN